MHVLFTMRHPQPQDGLLLVVLAASLLLQYAMLLLLHVVVSAIDSTAESDAPTSILLVPTAIFNSLNWRPPHPPPRISLG